MAAFYTPDKPTNDPDYVGASKAPDRVAPLQQVSIPAYNNQDTSLGTALSGAANLLDTGLTAGYTVMKEQIKKDAQAAIDPIRDAHGANLSPEEAAAVAGTGAKGRARSLAMGVSPSFTDYGDPTSGGGTVAVDGGVEKPLPANAAIEIGRISRLNQGYQSGQMSDSYYNAELIAAKKELRARYPGFRDEVDAAFDKITGTDNANSIRRSVLSDMNANAAAMAANAADKNKWALTNGADISRVYPDFQATGGFQGKYRGRENEVQGNVFNMQGHDAQLRSSELQAGFDSKNWQAVTTAGANNIANTGVSAVTNQLGISSLPDLQQKIAGLATTGADPKEIAGLRNQLDILTTQKETEIRAWYNQPAPGVADGRTRAQMINDPAKVDAIVQSALQPYKVLQTAIAKQDWSTAYVVSQEVGRLKNVATANVLTKAPIMQIVAGLQGAGGDQVVPTILQGSTLLPKIQSQVSALVLETAGATPDKPPKGINDQLERYGSANGDQPAPGNVVRELVQKNLAIINKREIPEDISANGVRNLFDKKFFANTDDNRKLQMYGMMTNPQTADRVWELSKNDPELWRQYKDWTLYAGSIVGGQSASSLNTYLKNPEFEISYNENTHMIEGTMKPEFRDITREAMMRKTVQDTNKVLTPLTNLWAKEGQDPNEAAAKFFTGSNVNWYQNKAVDDAATNLGRLIINHTKSLIKQAGKESEEATAGANKAVMDRVNDPLSPKNWISAVDEQGKDLIKP